MFEERRRNHRSASISSLGSTDSANLDDLIRNNCVAQVDDETDLPDLADLDLDDSADDFWKMNDVSLPCVRVCVYTYPWRLTMTRSWRMGIQMRHYQLTEIMSCFLLTRLLMNKNS